MSIAQAKRKAFISYVIQQSQPFGLAMITIAEKIQANPALYHQVLQLSDSFGKMESSQHEKYETELRTILTANISSMSQPDSENQLQAAMGFLNLKARDPEFNPTTEGFDKLVREAANDYLDAVEQKGDLSLAKAKLKSAIVAGQFDTGPASPIILEAISNKPRGSSLPDF